RLSDKQELQSIPFGLGLAPLGVAFAPDGTRVYVAVADLTPAAGSLHVYDVQTGGLIDSESVGELPTALAVTPDGNLVHVTNKTDGTISVYDTQTSSVVRTVTVGTSPVGIAISPDGARAYVANNGSANVSVFDTLTGAAVSGSPLSVGVQPIAVAINSQGTTAYVSNVAGTPTVVEVGGLRTLTILRAGSGIGTVTSNPPGIDCGTQCQARFPAAPAVMLSAVPGPNSTFSGWSGPGCGFSVTLDVNRTCTATFSSTLPPPSTTPPPWCTAPATTGCCFIATAAYGSAMDEDVALLRRFRDDTLNASALGRGFVRLYYRYSPPLADYIRGRDGVRATVRAALKPLVLAIRHPQGAAGLTLALLLAVLGWRRIRRRRAATQS
ncbi:MAG TPA: YncE family protein, partial [Burkholderiales bacterium]|nr:YncE family protein [Burkholderiales bacterium]